MESYDLATMRNSKDDSNKVSIKDLDTNPNPPINNQQQTDKMTLMERVRRKHENFREKDDAENQNGGWTQPDSLPLSSVNNQQNTDQSSLIDRLRRKDEHFREKDDARDPLGGLKQQASSIMLPGKTLHNNENLSLIERLRKKYKNVLEKDDIELPNSPQLATKCKNGRNGRFKRDVCGQGNTGGPIEIYHGQMTTNYKQHENYKKMFESAFSWPKKCGNLGCVSEVDGKPKGDAEVGAHVYWSKDLKDSSKAMIVPTCNKCNNHAGNEKRLDKYRCRLYLKSLNMVIK